MPEGMSKFQSVTITETLEMTGQGHRSCMGYSRHWVMTGHGHQAYSRTINKTLEMTGHGHWSYMDNHRHWVMTGHGQQAI
jgi:hypothetical protein